MAKEKLTTAEILAQARRQDAGGGGDSAGGSDPPGNSSAQPDAAEEATSSTSSQPKPPAAAPKSTADILAAARAQAGGGGAKPSDSAGEKKPATTPKPGGAPKSTADILAAARAQGGGGAAKTPAADESPGKPAAKKPAAKPAAVGDRPPVEEMVRRMHQGKPAATKPARPKLPSKPPLPAKRPQQEVTRRAFPVALIASIAAIAMTPFALGMVLLGAIFGLWSLLTARFMMPNMVVELPQQFKVGPPADIPPGTVSEKFIASRGVWLVRSDSYNGEDIIYALSSVCTHLGCTPNWLEGEQKFKCPCHGSGFYISGINFEGPAPRPLERVGLRVAEDGMLEVDKSVKFQEELGQWQDPKSYVALG